VTWVVRSSAEEYTCKSTTLFLFRRIKALVIPDPKPAFSPQLLAERLVPV
jgi:hypothetical protein